MTQDGRTGLTGKTILLVIGGGIAAYKALDLIRRFRERGAAVRPVMTAGAQQFITPLAVASLAGMPAHTDLFALTDEAAMGHIELSRAADLVVVAPATANLLAKIACGLADDLASTLLLATDKRTLVAPAMNLRMWLHPATQRNVATLRGDGVRFVGPDDGAMACGEFGPGRMAEPLAIVAAAEDALAADTLLPFPPPVAALQPGASLQSLRGRHVVVTSGPTHEPLDPVRYLANRSSGRQGHAIAQAAAQAGGRVTLVSGPVTIPDPPGVTVVRVTTAREMLAAVDAALPADLFVGVAAVADWRPASVASGKLKKRENAEAPTLQLAENPDILAAVGRRTEGRPRFVVGFAAETDDLLANAAAKLDRKGCDTIVANDVGGDGVMGGDRNTVHLLTRSGIESWPTLSKTAVAERLVAYCAVRLAELDP